MKVFLGGTCNNSKWRDELIPELKRRGIEYFNPVVSDWTPECQELENRIKADPNTINLFYITHDMTGVYSIAEVVDCSNKRPDTTVFAVQWDGFTEGQRRSLEAVGSLVSKNGAHFVRDESRVPEIVERIFELRAKWQ